RRSSSSTWTCSATPIRRRSDSAATDTAVVPAQAGTHIPELVVMGPRFRGDDTVRLATTPRTRMRAKRDSEHSEMHNGHDIAKLIEPGRVHRDVYTDPDVFELEMERIFSRAWLFVGHTSQVPRPGDYVTTELGRQPVVMTRHRD